MDLTTIKSFSPSELNTYFTAWEKSLGTVESSSIGRLFDAVASLLGICQVMSYEGESGMMMEEFYEPNITGSYPFSCEKGKIDILPMIEAMLEEKNIRSAVSRFFHTLVEIRNNFV